MKATAVHVGLIGCGTVGTGVARILLTEKRALREQLGLPLELVRIADLNTRPRKGVPTTPGLLTKSADAVLNDPHIEIVVELVGGLTFAKEVILRAMRSGKHVVTANKALLAAAGPELHAVAQEHNVDLFYEASVAGGIPIIKSLREGFVANRLHAVLGIVNGTCNYILTRMTQDGLEFRAAVREAQRKGYAEANPALDIDGLDARHKLGILASLAFDQWVPQEAIYVEGIRRITKLDIQCAGELGYVVKFLAIARAGERGIELRVHPTLLPQHSMFEGVRDAYNAIEVRGTPIGTTMFYGMGAGMNATSSAVVADIVDIARNVQHPLQKRRPPFMFGAEKQRLLPMANVCTKYFLRCTTLDRPGVIAAISRELGARNIGLTSVILHETARGAYSTILFMTHQAREADVQNALQAIDALPVIKAKTAMLRVETETN
ncbi:MAG: homoserine dehydrogenase [bacterium]|nr:homoserine dehydrogenase [bacterium]